MQNPSHQHCALNNINNILKLKLFHWLLIKFSAKSCGTKSCGQINLEEKNGKYIKIKTISSSVEFLEKLFLNYK